ncbi:hypothetical protein D7V93_24285 [Corallococcus llansteffanensis]|uniref:Uncharacterized protein n=1 Tax=Corallococcus llansteffanensis TaxID=2316731 RepID=A0A3A8PMQ4_9BACT|nr:hypothetical protein D7V93_24285 [Corallococcus llansteffanensis]
MGADFLVLNTFALDYERSLVFRNRSGSLCDDDQLKSAGLRPLTTRGYFAINDSGLFNMTRLRSGAGASELVPNVPTVPLRMGGARFIGQLDSGLDDSIVRHSLYGNKALLEMLTKAGVKTVPVGTPPSQLSACGGANDTVQEFLLPEGARLEFMGTDDQPVRSYGDAHLFIKTPTPASLKCGGIATWTTPAAQVGNSFLRDARFVLYDATRMLVWIHKD